MTARPIVVRPLARRDVTRAARRYERESAGLGSRFVAAVDVAFTSAASAAEQYPVVYGEVRRVRVAVFPYGVYFVIRANAVHVLVGDHGDHASCG